MCGIFGITNFQSKLSLESLSKILSLQTHRGPDATGTWSDENIFLGHNRLSIIDLDERSNQPMISRCGNYAIVYNGEIYNYQEVKKKLDFKNWRTEGDTEVLLQGYIEMGANILNELNGMFAFAVYHISERKLFVARDRVGIKPFYYVTKSESFAFASELKPLVQLPFVSKNVNPSALSQYLTFQSTIAPQTLIEDIKVLPSGCFGIFENNNWSISKYWSISDRTKYLYKTKEDAQQEISSIFKDSVGLRMISDVPVGAFLSGGIDSSLVVSQMASIGGSIVTTKSIGFKEAEYDETEIAQVVANKYHTNHERIELDSTTFAERIPNILSKMDSPSLDGVNTYLVSEAVKKSGITVALSGLGGDELFAGYSYHRLFKRFRQLHIALSPIGHLLSPFTSLFKNSRYRKLIESAANSTDTDKLYASLRSVFSKNEVNQLTGQISPVEFREKELDQFPYYSQFGALDMLGYTQNVLLKDTDQMSMQHALEVRVPFFDYRLIEASMSIPDSWKFDGKRNKSFLLDSFEGQLPTEVFNRKKWDLCYLMING
ncbi:MAG: asparagine synthase (glutamine-hydrolyzing) [Bacteroidia bacterium]